MNEYEKLSGIADKLAKGTLPDQNEARWLISALRQALRGRVDDFIFPEYAGLILTVTKGMLVKGSVELPDNVKATVGERAAFALRLLAKVDWRAETTLGPGILGLQPSDGAKVFWRETFCHVSDAFMVVRPYVRVHAETPPAAYEELRRCSLTMSFGKEEVVSQAPIDDYLIGPDGRSVRGLSPQLFISDEMETFQACELDDESNAHMAKRIGAFIPSNTYVSVVLSGPSVKGPIKLVAGVVAAQFTTRSAETPK